VQLTYPEPEIDLRPTRRTISTGQRSLASPSASSPGGLVNPRIGLLGAGNFVRATLLPAIKEAELGPVEAICSAGGASARFLADKHGIPKVSTDASEVINDPDIDLIMIATPHDTHADLVVEALEAGKHVFCEKPLALTHEELDRIEAAWENSDRVLQVGFNRRYAPAVVKAKEILGDTGGPLVITYRVNAGELPESHWYHDRRYGGRLIGEACHFIDLCAHLIGLPSSSQAAMGGGPASAPAAHIVALGYADGSVATISYAPSGHESMSKERIDIIGRGHSITIDDFVRLTINGRVDHRSAGKGHAQQLNGLRISSVRPSATRDDLLSMRTAVTCSSPLGEGTRVDHLPTNEAVGV
jgi:predicted dehydrogenase